MNQRNWALTIIACILGIGILGSPEVAAQKAEQTKTEKSQTAKTVKPETMTCEEFLVLGKEVQPNVVYWIEGYSESGTIKEKGIVIEALERPIHAVVEECKKSPKDTVMRTIKAVF
ncbi:MAG: acid stress chaperone HdeA [Candidatus Binatota bacterium]|nr:acid stress chaperone HdeA [Candidatus Binatota bacterium]